MFILCKGVVAKKPYVIPVSQVPVYSVEELVHYMYHNIYRVTEDFFDQRLVTWLREEVRYETLAKKMKVLIEKHHDIKDLVVTLLCSCDYFKEDEIVELVKVMERISNLPEYEKRKIKADNYLKADKYQESLLEYRKLLQGDSIRYFTTEEYGDLLHNQSIAMLHVGSFREAAQGFMEAYARNQREESLQQYLMVLLMMGDDEKFLQQGVVNGVSPEKAGQWKKEYEEFCQGLPKEEVAEDFIERCKMELRNGEKDENQLVLEQEKDSGQ